MAKTLSTSGINSGQLIRTTQLTQVVDALTGNDDYDISISGSLIITGSTNISGSLTAVSMSGDGSGLTGVTGEWDGTHVGNAEITGSLVVTQNITGSNISSSGTVIGLSGSFSELSGASPLTINGITTFTQPITASGNISSSGYISASGIHNVGNLSLEESILLYNNKPLQGLNTSNTSYNLINFDTNNFITIGSNVGSNTWTKLEGSAIQIKAYLGNINLLPGGDVGIGNSYPASKLHVTGDIWASGSNGNITSSANISASGNVYGVTGSFSYLNAAGSNNEIQFNKNGGIGSNSAFKYVDGLGGFLVGDGFGQNTISASAISARLTIGDADSSMTGHKIDIINNGSHGGKTEGIHIEGPTLFDSNITASGLPTSEPTSTGSLWISGSSPNHPNSGFLMIYNP